MTELEAQNKSVKYIKLSYDSSQASIKELALEKAFKDITITGETVIGDLWYEGTAMFMAYKYPNSEYGMICAAWYNETGHIRMMTVIDGEYHHSTLS